MEIYSYELETGGSFSIQGFKCLSLSEVTKIRPEKVVFAGCGETVYNHPLLSTLPIEVGDKFTINCVEGCSNKDARILYGVSEYPDVSGLCVSAYHAGVILDKGGEFMIEILAGKPNYIGKKMNGIESRSYAGTDFAMKFQAAGLQMFTPFVGQEVDFLVKDKYLKGIITEVKPKT